MRRWRERCQKNGYRRAALWPFGTLAGDHLSFYGVSFEFSVNYKYCESGRVTKPQIWFEMRFSQTNRLRRGSAGAYVSAVERTA